jgi:LacI family transcriptional regulator/LacI family repressor for deo operon, udp, cdd, tsx, nupC, and nupG
VYHGRITQEDVARRAGVTRATVSMALKGHSSIPEKTRNRILRIAAKLGYSPDPMLSALAAYRSRSRPPTFHGTLAWLIDSAFGYDWRGVPQFCDYHFGALTRAKRYGFNLETFDLNAPEMTRERLAAIFRARNIQGLLLCPQPRSETTLEFAWAEFSAVTFGYTLASPHLHTVVSTQYRDMLLTLLHVQARGYQRIGLMLNHEHDLRTNYNYRSGYLIAQSLRPKSPRLPILESTYDDYEALRRWIRKNLPDVIIACGGETCVRTLKRLGVRVPQDVGLALPNLAAATSRVSGVVENSTEIGAVAVDLIVAMMQRGERGIPEYPQRIHVEGAWHPGNTLRLPAP